MANQGQSQDRGMQTRNRPGPMQTRQGEQQGQTYYSYSYGYGYYDPFTGDWVEEIYGPFTGVGPLNYQRSDDRIEEDVCDRLAQHGQLDASNIDVSVDNGEVTLKGEVPDRRMKRLAEDIAFGVPGVFDVQNQLRINKQMGQGQSFRSQLRTGLEVDDSTGKKLGSVKEIHDYDFLIDRTMAPDLHVPFSAIHNISSNKVMLNLTGDQIDKMHWATSAKQTAGAR